MIHKILAGIAICAACFLCLVAGMRDDHEVTALEDDGDGIVNLTLPSDSSASLFFCSHNAADVPAEFHIDGQVYEVPDPVRPVKLSQKTAEHFKVSPDLSCNSLWQEIPPSPDGASEQTLEITHLPFGTFVIAASSRHAGWLPLLLGFIAFLGTLFTAVALASPKARPYRPAFKPYDAASAFFLAMGLSLLLSLPFSKALEGPETQILPTFLDFLPVLSVNFVAMLTTFAGFFWFRTRAAAKAPIAEDEAPSADETPAEVNPHVFNPLVSLSLGIGLAIVAAVTLTLLSPTVELTQIEMATQLVSTSYLTFIFAILAGISEECLFRGVIQSSLEARPASKHPLLMNTLAVAVATTLFVGVHVPQSIGHLWALIPIGAVSVTSGILKIRYRSLYPSILLHMTYNTVLLVPSMLQLILFLG